LPELPKFVIAGIENQKQIPFFRSISARNRDVWSNELRPALARFTAKGKNFMGWLGSILRMLAPIAVEHGGQVLRDQLRSRAAQPQPEAPAGPDPVQLLAEDVDRLKAYSLELKSEIETLNIGVAAREERLRKWLLALLIWNAVLTIGLVLLAVFALRR
jgi:hypothetical protein